MISRTAGKSKCLYALSEMSYCLLLKDTDIRCPEHEQTGTNRVRNHVNKRTPLNVQQKISQLIFAILAHRLHPPWRLEAMACQQINRFVSTLSNCTFREYTMTMTRLTQIFRLRWHQTSRSSSFTTPAQLFRPSGATYNLTNGFTVSPHITCYSDPWYPPAYKWSVLKKGHLADISALTKHLKPLPYITMCSLYVHTEKWK